ncbi:hypothetical protein BGZ76_008309 [Entomortierella beljakovae]|nr:hypothetical protein BGZ76_008309 [Entomortierella beljakovae]
MYPTVHSIASNTSSTPTYTLLNRSNSLPANKQRRASNAIQAVGSSLAQKHHDYWTTFNTSTSKVGPSDTSCTLSRSPRVSKQAFRTPSTESLHLKSTECNPKGELSQQQSVGNLIHTPPVSPSSSLDSCPGTDCGSSIPKTVGRTDKRSMNGCESTETARTSVMIPTLTIPNRSSSNSSERSNSSTAMPLTGSNMSIQSQMSESSILSAAMVANGLPSVQVMKSQVDKSLEADTQAQLVENVHLGVVSHISFVDTRLIVEPCSAVIETWVN